MGGHRKTVLDRRLQAEARATALAGLSTRARLKKRLGWPVCAGGVVLFGATFVANAAGVELLPFDQHHLIGQLGGGALAVLGLNWATAS